MSLHPGTRRKRSTAASCRPGTTAWSAPRGTLEFFDDAELLRAQVTRLTDKFEGRYASPWQVSDAPADYLERQFKGIVGIRLRIEALEGKTKLSQNRPEADRIGVAAALREGEHEAERSVAALMDTPAG